MWRGYHLRQTKLSVLGLVFLGVLLKYVLRGATLQGGSEQVPGFTPLFEQVCSLCLEKWWLKVLGLHILVSVIS